VSFRRGDVVIGPRRVADPFHPRHRFCYETVPGRAGRTRGGRALRIERFPDVDLAALPLHPTPPDFWQERAACFGVEPDVFFPVSEEEAGPALAFCGVCRIREECLSWALKNGERYGVWGGTTEQQRRRLQRHVA
jgi:WhiB family transcriptional regulator, redox-sensing transcriptional regulator